MTRLTPRFMTITANTVTRTRNEKSAPDRHNAVLWIIPVIQMSG